MKLSLYVLITCIPKYTKIQKQILQTLNHTRTQMIQSILWTYLIVKKGRFSKGKKKKGMTSYNKKIRLSKTFICNFQICILRENIFFSLVTTPVPHTRNCSNSLQEAESDCPTWCKMWSPILGTEQSQKPSSPLTEWEQLCREGPQGHSGEVDEKSAVQPHSEWWLTNTAQHWQEHGQQVQKWHFPLFSTHEITWGVLRPALGCQHEAHWGRWGWRPPKWLQMDGARSVQPREKGSTIAVFSYKMGSVMEDGARHFLVAPKEQEAHFVARGAPTR